jgi:hypothetical protein
VSSYRKVDDTAAQLLDFYSIEVHEIVAALAEMFSYDGIPAHQASRQARDMIALAMEDPDRFDAIFGDTYH